MTLRSQEPSYSHSWTREKITGTGQELQAQNFGERGGSRRASRIDTSKSPEMPDALLRNPQPPPIHRQPSPSPHLQCESSLDRPSTLTSTIHHPGPNHRRATTARPPPPAIHPVHHPVSTCSEATRRPDPRLTNRSRSQQPARPISLRHPTPPTADRCHRDHPPTATASTALPATDDHRRPPSTITSRPTPSIAASARSRREPQRQRLSYLGTKRSLRTVATSRPPHELPSNESTPSIR